ncbi:PREDICTED: protein MAK16 homolog isoform X1 [Brassica oleracea var. oleracea]|uniref:protein MAK16 homolog isoform X1 n=1 Tax=Brassica oleracea var. oleracea TaxID=109376 RepID=UPI0006A701D7|nr:PREDICTED: protein MAK16 homolog isoform X1 [Brassica oleracea var. oleracea]
MQDDEVIWQAIRHNHCSYMAKIETGIFCRNPYNVTGICNRSSCPLANSRYATIRDHDGVFYLYMKTIERAHMPKNLWERIKLPRNYEKALELIDKHLLYWPKLLQHKVKQRLNKMTQIRIRTRKLNLKTREKIMTMARRDIKREPRREEKALKAAQLEKSIETELLERLMKGVYPKILDYPELVTDVQKEVEVEEEEEEEEPEIEYVEGYDELLEEVEEDIEDFYGGFPSKESHLDGDDDYDFEDDDDGEEQVVIHKKGRSLKKFDGNGKSKKKSRVVVEVEQEDDTRQSLKSLKL